MAMAVLEAALTMQAVAKALAGVAAVQLLLPLMIGVAQLAAVAPRSISMSGAHKRLSLLA